MNRRDFIKKSLLAGSAAALSVNTAEALRATEPSSKHKDTDFDTAGFITEPSRRISVLTRCDVVVVGGGPAGVAAAIAAAREGASTVLLERYNHLGGLWTGGLVLPTNCTHGCAPSGRREQAIHGICKEITHRLESLHASVREVNPVIDPEACKYVLDCLCKDARVEVVYHCLATQIVRDGNAISGIIIESKSGRQAVMCKAVVDATGDGDIFHWAGEDYDKIQYYIGYASRLGGCERINTHADGYRKIPVGILDTPQRGVRWNSFSIRAQTPQDGLDVRNLSRIQQQLRKQLWEQVESIRHTPGYEQVYLLDSASQLGVRATRILHGRYRLTLDDSMTYKTFDDCIGLSGAWTQIPYKDHMVERSKRPIWQIPYRALLPKKTPNLLVAGRCFSFDKGLLEDAREIGTCLVTGQAAGTAAALAVAKHTSTDDVDIRQLQARLSAQDVRLTL